METLEVLINQLEQNVKLKIKDELILIKIEQTLNSLIISSAEITIETEESFFILTLNTYSLYKKYSQETINKSIQFDIFMTRILQISCELTNFALYIEDKLNCYNMISNWKEIMFNILEITIKTCLKWIEIDINTYRNLINKNLTQSRNIYEKYLNFNEKEENDFFSKENNDINNLEIISLYFILELEIQIEYLDEKNADKRSEYLLLKLKRIFEIMEINYFFKQNQFFSKKIANICFKTIVKLIQLNFFQNSKNFLLLFLINDNFDMGNIFKNIDNKILENYNENLLKLFIFVEIEIEGIEKSKIIDFLLNSELLNKNQNSKQTEIFFFILELKKNKKKKTFNQEIIFQKFLNLLEFKISIIEFQTILSEVDIKFQKLQFFMIIEFLKNYLDNNNLNEIGECGLLFANNLKLLMDNYEKLEINEYNEIINYFNETNYFDVILDYLIKASLSPKKSMFFQQIVLRFCLFLSNSLKNYVLSSKILNKLLVLQYKTTAKNNKNLYRETCSIQMNNYLMINDYKSAEELYNICKDYDLSLKNFCERIFIIKYQIMTQTSEDSIILGLKEIFKSEEFDYDVFLSEIIEPLFEKDENEENNAKIKLIFAVLFEILCKNTEQIYKWMNFLKNKNCFDFSFSFLGILKSIIKNKWVKLIDENILEKKKELEIMLLKTENIKEILVIGNFIEDCFKIVFEIEQKTEKEDKTQGFYYWLININDTLFLEVFFWNLTILAGSLKMEIILTRKLIYFVLMMKLIKIIIINKFEDISQNYENNNFHLSLLKEIMNRIENIDKNLLLELVQNLLLLITNYFVTIKMDLNNLRESVRNKDIDFLENIINLSIEINEYLLDNEIEVNKIKKTQMLLISNQFELNIIINPNKFSVYALRTYLKTCFHENYENQKILPMRAYRDILQETTNEEEYLSYLKQIILYFDITLKNNCNENNLTINKNEIIGIILLSFKKCSFFKTIKDELMKNLFVIYEITKSLMTNTEKERLEDFFAKL